MSSSRFKKPLAKTSVNSAEGAMMAVPAALVPNPGNWNILTVKMDGQPVYFRGSPPSTSSQESLSRQAAAPFT